MPFLLWMKKILNHQVVSLTYGETRTRAVKKKTRQIASKKERELQTQLWSKVRRILIGLLITSIMRARRGHISIWLAETLLNRWKSYLTLIHNQTFLNLGQIEKCQVHQMRTKSYQTQKRTQLLIVMKVGLMDRSLKSISLTNNLRIKIKIRCLQTSL